MIISVSLRIDISFSAHAPDRHGGRSLPDSRRIDPHQQIIAIHLLAFFHDDFGDGAIGAGADGGEHFHGFQHDEFVAGPDFLAGGDRDFGDHAGHRRAGLPGSPLARAAVAADLRDLSSTADSRGMPLSS